MALQIDTDVSSSDPFYPLYTSIVTHIITRVKPVKQDVLWPVIQTLFDDTPTRFTLISGLHQNDEHDRLHLSVKVQLNYSYLTLHMYGYWKTVFQCTDVTYLGHNMPAPAPLVDFR